jgi:pimeloyl-ACP methyl ester carboxylesterase
MVTSLSAEEWEARALYEQLYGARGEMENRIKEQLALFADRTSTAWLRSNQVRLYFSSVAYLLMQALRRLGLRGTELAQAQCATIRLKLLKIGAQIRVTVRRVAGLRGFQPEVYLGDEVPKLRPPTLIIWGEKDMAPTAVGQQASRRIPRARFVEMPGIGHFPFLGAPKKCADLMVEFLKE